MKEKFFETAKKISKKSDHKHYQLGAVIVNKHKILGIGFNRAKTHPKSPHFYKHLHAEVDAIIGIDYSELKGSTIYIYRENKQGIPALAKPCPSCMEAIKAAGIKTMCYTTYGSYKCEEVNP